MFLNILVSETTNWPLVAICLVLVSFFILRAGYLCYRPVKKKNEIEEIKEMDKKEKAAIKRFFEKQEYYRYCRENPLK